MFYDLRVFCLDHTKIRTEAGHRGGLFGALRSATCHASDRDITQGWGTLKLDLRSKDSMIEYVLFWFSVLCTCMGLASCISESLYESEGPYSVTLTSASDSCSRAWLTMVIDDLTYPGYTLRGFYLPESFLTTEGTHRIEVWCMNKRNSSTTGEVWVDTVDIVSDTTFLFDCANCDLSE